MGIFDFARKPKQEKVNVPKIFGYSFLGKTYFYPNRDKKLFNEFYKQNVHVRAVIDKIVSSFGKYGFDFYFDDKEVDIKFINEIVNYNNGGKTFKDFLNNLVLDLEITGEAYVYILKSGDGKIIGIDNIDSQTMTPVYTNTGYIYGFIQNINGKKTEFSTDEVFYIKSGKNPDNPILGFSKLNNLFYEIEAQKEINNSNLAYFKNNQTPGSLFILEDDVNELEAENITGVLEEFINSGDFTGGKNFHKSAYIKGVKDIKTIQKRMSDGDFLNLKKFDLFSICSVFGVPMDILGFTENSNKAVSDVQYNNFLDMIEGLEKEIEDFLNVIFQKVIGNFRVEILQDNLRKLKDKKDIAVELYEKGIINLNEAREMLQYEEVSNGNEFKKTDKIEEMKNLLE